MAKTVDRRTESSPSPKDVGRQLRHVRRKQGLSRSEVARSAGLTRRELAAYERGRVDIPESDLWCLAGSCGVDVGELLPHRDKLRVDSDLSSLAIGDTIRHLRSPGEPNGLLGEYLAMIYELRNLPPGTRVPLREEDLHTLAEALGGSPDVIEARLGELIGANRDEAARLRAMILPPMALPAPGSEGPATDDFFATPSAPGSEGPATDDFFATPRAEDPFAPPPPLEVASLDTSPMAGLPTADAPLDDSAMADSAVTDPAMPPMQPVAPMEPVVPTSALPLDAPPPVDAVPVDLPPPVDAVPVDAFAAPAEGPDPLAVLRVDPFASSDGARPDGPREVAPDAARDGIVVDLGEPMPPSSWEDEAGEPRIAPHTVLDVPPAPLGEAPIDVEGLDVEHLAPVGAMHPELEPPDVADYADVFDSAPPEVAALDSTPLDTTTFTEAPLDRVPFGLETDAEPLLDPDPVPAAPIEVASMDPTPVDLAPADVAPIDAEPVTPDPIAPEPIVTEPIEVDEPVEVVTEPIVTEPIVVDEPVEVVTEPVEVDEPVAIKWHAPSTIAVEADEAAPIAADDNGAAHFTKAGPGWQVGGMSPATAMADDGALALRRADARWALCDVHQAGDFTAEAVVEFTSGSGFGILFRAGVDEHDRIDAYSFDIDAVTGGGGGYLIRQWEANRPHWRPLAQAHVTDPSMLFGRHTITLTVRGDQLTVQVDGETVLTATSLSRLSVDLGREPARGDRLGVQAGTTTEVTVDRFAAAAL